MPFYIAVAIGAAIVHTYGYSLIFQARATPGGLEIITSYLSSSRKKRKKASISFLFKLFGFLIIFAITFFNFAFVEDNVKVRKAELKTYLLKASEKTGRNFIKREEDLEVTLEK